MARPKGYAAWEPKDETRALLGQVVQVLEEYRDHLPLTVRQIFYRLVGQYGYDKTERAYARLCEHLVRARRARLIPFDSIRDDGTIVWEPQQWTNVADFWDQVERKERHARRDRIQDQPVRVELWCEAAGMVPQLARVAFRYSVPVYSTGGFSSVTVTHEIAQRALDDDRPTVFLHVGDYDPSGESIFEAMSLDAWTFVAQTRMREWHDQGLDTPERRERVGEMQGGGGDGPGRRPGWVAPTEAPGEEDGPPAGPPKRSDTRSRTWSGLDTCQAEAMPPDLLAEVVEAAIQDELDLDLWQGQVDLEAEDRNAIGDGLDEARRGSGE